MPTFSHIGGAEPSTLTFKAATLTQTRNSSVMHQEVVSIGDTESSLGIAAVLAAAPASTAWGLVTREVAPIVKLESTVIQGTSPWVTQTSFPAGYISSVVQSGNSSGLTVRPVWSSSGVDQPVRALLSSTRADNVVNIDGQSTCIQGTNPWVIGFQAGNISSVAQSGNSSGVTVRPVWSSSNADQPVSAVLNLGGLQSSVVPAAGSSALLVRLVGAKADNLITVYQSSAAELNATVIFPAGYISSGIQAGGSSALTVRNVWSSTNADQPVSATLNLGGLQSSVVPGAGSSALLVRLVGAKADNLITVYQSSATELKATVTIDTALQSTAAPSSGSSGLIVRQVVDNILVTTSTNAFASTSLTIQSSAAGIRSYVIGYSITSTFQTPTSYKFYTAATLLWSVRLAALSSAVAGANLAVGAAPAYLFRTNAADPLTIQVSGSTITNVNVSVSYFRAV